MFYLILDMLIFITWKYDFEILSPLLSIMLFSNVFQFYIFSSISFVSLTLFPIETEFNFLFKVLISLNQKNDYFKDTVFDPYVNSFQ